MFDSLGLVATDDLVTLYQWKNGFKDTNFPSGKLVFGVDGVFFPLEVSKVVYESQIQLGVGQRLFPVFADDSFLIKS